MTLTAKKATSEAQPSTALIRAAGLAGVILALLLGVMIVEMFLMLQEMRQLGSSLPTSAPSVNRLDAMRADLDRIQPDIHQVDARLGQVQSNTANLDPSLADLSAKIAKLDADLGQVMTELKDVDQHVANLDRKTGPTVSAVP